SAPSVPNTPSIPGAPAAPSAAKPPSVPTAPGTPSAPQAPSAPSAPAASVPTAPVAPGAPQAAAQTQQVEPKGSSSQEPQKAPATQSNTLKTDDKRYGLFTLMHLLGGGILVIIGISINRSVAVLASRLFITS